MVEDASAKIAKIYDLIVLFIQKSFKNNNNKTLNYHGYCNMQENASAKRLSGAHMQITCNTLKLFLRKENSLISMF